MTSSVEILEIQSVVCDLVNRVPIKMISSKFVLDDKDHAIYKKNCVSTPTNPGNLEFKEKVTRR